jgi:DNA-binding LacI/PurR family transcriptional regulator
LARSKPLGNTNSFCFFSTQETIDPHAEMRAINMMRDHQVEGIIYATMYHRQIKHS